MPRLFALDKNFQSRSLASCQTFKLTRSSYLSTASTRACRRSMTGSCCLRCTIHPDPWDGLVTTDSSMLTQGPELATLIQTKLTLVVAVASGHNPVKASGLLFAYLSGICQSTTPERAQVWRLNAANRPHEEPWDFLKRFAKHSGRAAEDVWAEFKLSAAAIARDPLS